MLKVTRRTLLGSVATAGAMAQIPPAAPATAPDYLTISADQNKRNSDAIAKVQVPQSTEPAFLFKA